MSKKKYSEQHEWVSVEGDIGTVGITNFAQEQLGDVVFIELPSIGKVMTQGEEAAVIESVKAASEIYAPVGGEVIEVNDDLVEQPGMVNVSAEEEGWIFKLRLTDSSELENLMDNDGYRLYAENED